MQVRTYLVRQRCTRRIDPVPFTPKRLRRAGVLRRSTRPSPDPCSATGSKGSSDTDPAVWDGPGLSVAYRLVRKDIADQGGMRETADVRLITRRPEGSNRHAGAWPSD